MKRSQFFVPTWVGPKKLQRISKKRLENYTKFLKKYKKFHSIETSHNPAKTEQKEMDNIVTERSYSNANASPFRPHLEHFLSKFPECNKHMSFPKINLYFWPESVSYLDNVPNSNIQWMESFIRTREIWREMSEKSKSVHHSCINLKRER